MPIPPLPAGMPLKDVLLVLAVVTVWGLNFLAIKIGVGEVPPLLFTGLRFTFTLFPAVFFLPRPNVPWRILLGFGFMLGVVKFGLVFSAIKLGMPTGLTSLAMQMQVFFTILLGFFLLGERPTRIHIIGAVVAFCGIAIIAVERMAGAGFLTFGMILAASASWGVANILVKKAGRVNMLAFLVWGSLAAPLPLFTLSYLMEGWPAMRAALAAPHLSGILALAFIVYPSTLFAFGAWNALLARHPVSVVTPFALLVPVVGFLTGSLVLGEPFSLLTMLGSAVVFCGLCVNVFGDRLVRHLRRKMV